MLLTFKSSSYFSDIVLEFLTILAILVLVLINQFLIKKRVLQVSQLNSIRGKRCDSLYSKKSTSYHYVAKTHTKLFHALLRAMHALEIQIHMISRQVMFMEAFQKN